MEQLALATETEERELKRIGRQVARALESSDGRAISAARRKLFESKEERSGAGRWVFAVAAVGAAAAIFFALRTDPAPAPPAAARGADRGAAPGPTPVAKEAVRAADSAKAHTTEGPGGGHELVLDDGEARGKLGQGSETASIAAGPYRVTGDARVVVTWSATGGLEVEVSEGEARILAPGMTPAIAAPGSPVKRPAKR